MESIRDLRELTGHKVNGCNDVIRIAVADEPGSGGACHKYRVYVGEEVYPLVISFQNGPVNEVGTNGLTHEVLLAILEDRLEGFQAGPYECKENQLALIYIQAAMDVLKVRTRKRLERGVEGTHEI